MKVGLRHRTPVNVVFVEHFQHVEKLPTFNNEPVNESSQTLMKVRLRHRTPVNVVFVGHFQHVEKLPTFNNELW